MVALLLLWSELRAEAVAVTASPLNKFLAACLLSAAASIFRFVPLAGLGGEERTSGASVACGPGGGRGDVVSAWVRGAGRRLFAGPLSAPPLLACLGGKGKPEWMGPRGDKPLFFVKRSLCCLVFLQAPLLHLAGLGCEGVDKGGLVVLHRKRGSRLESL
jgi:hypothetical protein